MTPHSPGCTRGDWLRRDVRIRPAAGGLSALVAVLLLRDGPACDCSALNTPEQSPGRDGRGASAAHPHEYRGQARVAHPIGR